MGSWMAHEIQCLDDSDKAPPKQIIHDYSLHNQVLETVPFAKYLGITVEELSGAAVSRLNYYVGDPRSIPAGAKFPTGI